MNDEHKTKKELIAELAALRKQVGEDESGARRERAVERIRAEVASMRTGDDLVKVVALMRREMVGLGIDAHVAAIGFIDADKKLWRWIMAMDGFRHYGMCAAEELPSGIHVVGEDHVKVDDEWIEVPYLIPVWKSGQPHTYKRDSRLKGDPQFRESMGFRDATESVLTHLPGEQYNTDVPFEHGVVSLAVEEPQEEYVEIVRELTRAVSLGYLRFLDFQQLEQQAESLTEQAEQARRERAVERVRAEAMAMRQGDDILKVVACLYHEMHRLGIDTMGASFFFCDESTETVTNYSTMPNPQTLGFHRDVDPDADQFLVTGNVITGELSTTTFENTSEWIDIWHAGKIVVDDVKGRYDDKEKLEVASQNLALLLDLSPEDAVMYMQTIWKDSVSRTSVPFRYGVVAFGKREVPAHTNLVAELVHSLELGFVRFLDFQKVDEAQRQLIDELEEELQTAHTLQMGLMPTEPPQIEGLDITGRCIPATHVGGDFFQYFQQDGKLSLCMADVTGHAMEAAVPVMMFSGVLKNEMRHDSPIDELFANLNETMHDALDSRTYVCFAMGELNVADRSFRLANSGCPYPFHYSASTGDIEEIQVDAYPLGVKAETAYATIETGLETGDYVVFCSDGLIEAANAREEIFGFEQTAETIRTGCAEGLSAEGLIDRLIGAVQVFASDEPQGDDMTCVVLRVEG